MGAPVAQSRYHLSGYNLSAAQSKQGSPKKDTYTEID